MGLLAALWGASYLFIVERGGTVPGARLNLLVSDTTVRCNRGSPIPLTSRQTIVAVVDDGLPAAEAVAAARVHFEHDVIYAEPGAALDDLRFDPYEVQHFRAKNMFFGGVQAVSRDPASGAMNGAGDPRRGGVAVSA